MSLLKLDNVSRQFTSVPIWEHLSLSLEKSDRIGVIGSNGSGKSTLLHILAGLESPDSGTRTQRPGVRIGFLTQHPTFPPGITIGEAIELGHRQATELLRHYEELCAQAQELETQALEQPLERLSELEQSKKRLWAEISEVSNRLDALNGWDIAARTHTIATRLSLPDLKTQLSTLSIGQRKRVAIAAALITEPDILLLDEPTNHLDTRTIDWLESYLRYYKGCLVFVTHDRYFLDQVASKILEIAQGSARSYEGSYAVYLEKKEHEAQLAQASEEKHDNLLRRELEWFKRGARARSTKQKARQERLSELLAKPPRREEAALSLQHIATGARLGNKGLLLCNVSHGFGSRRLINDFSLELKRGDRVGLVGANGCGKSTLLNIIAEQLEPESGHIELGTTVVTGYYRQDTSHVDPTMTALDYVRESAEIIRNVDGSIITAEAMLERFLFPRPVQRTPLGKLSGGEIKRLYLLRVLMGNPNLLLLDEPTNDLDLPTLLRLEAWLDDFPGILLVVSHDRYFLDRTVDKLYFLNPPHGPEYFTGDYDALRQCIAEQELNREQKENGQTNLTAKANGKTKTEPVVIKAPQMRKPRLSYKETRELESIEGEMETGDARVKELQEQLALPSSDAALTNALYTELQALQARLDKLLTRWAELEEIRNNCRQ